MKNALCYVYKVTTTLKGEEKKGEEPTTEAATTTAEAATEAPTTTAEEKKDEGTTTAKADEKKEEATEATTEKKDDKKEEAKKGEKVYYYFAYYQNVLSPGDPDKDYDAQSYNEPSYSNFFGVSGDAFAIDDVLYVGYENLDDLYKAVEDKFYYECKVETNIKKK